MDENHLKALLATLQLQRNNALDAVAQSEARCASLRARNEELEKQLASLPKEGSQPG